ncbi:MAG TPA: T9SS type A sorting domain-containing protein, partial [Flavobacterium sp.]|nr:T9SS type A sorting domain-containing protein [Flavobacterium sp.]
ITFKNCYWAEGCKERMPRARNAQLHILNCYYNTSVSGSLAIGLGGGNNNTTCYVEGTDFAKIGTAFKNYVSTDGGTIGISFNDCLNAPANSGTTVTKPAYSYSVLPTANVAGFVSNATCGAGATLQVTNQGVLSTSCNNLGLNDNVNNLNLKYYPSVINKLLNIDFSSSENGLAQVNLFSSNGTKVYSHSKNVSADEKLELNVGNLSQGIYICKVQIENRSKTFKLVKN